MEVNAKAGVVSFCWSREQMKLRLGREKKVEKLPVISEIKWHPSTARDGMTDINQTFSS